MLHFVNRSKLPSTISVIQDIKQLSPLSISKPTSKKNVGANKTVRVHDCNGMQTHMNSRLNKIMKLNNPMPNEFGSEKHLTILGHNFELERRISRRDISSSSPSFTVSKCSRNFSTICSNHFVHSLISSQQEIHHSQHHRNLWDFFKRNNFGNYVVIKDLGEVSNSLQVSSHIRCPPYSVTGHPLDGPRGPEVKPEWHVDAMRKSCSIARSVLNDIGNSIKAGMTTDDIDVLAHNKTIESGAYPSPLNYHGFPKSVCTSVNNIACHGIPNDRPLVDGDIISVDVTVFHDGFHGDCCETFLVGDVDEAGRHLVLAARKCRDEAIAICGPGVPFCDIGAKVEEVAKREGVAIVPCFIGHGIGYYFHGPPEIYHCYNDYPGTMEEGMTFTIEPVVAQGSEEVVLLEDGWTAVMLDNGRAAQFEHTVLITDGGHEILTAY